jgi:drug/metabolite transporter (DMT)-like permease
LGNMIVEVLARFCLHEAISRERWLGVVLITLGASLVAQGPSLTEKPAAERPAAKEVVTS